MARYEWDSPYEWLMEYAAKLDTSKLYQEFGVVAEKLDSDQIQDLYQDDMERSGYFKDLDAPENSEEEDEGEEARRTR
jgi:hypothetical protein